VWKNIIEKFEKHKDDKNKFLNSLTMDEFAEYVKERPFDEFKEAMKIKEEAA